MATFQVSPWAPYNESTTELFGERVTYDANHVGTFAYGVQTVIAFLTVKALLRMRRTRAHAATTLLVYVVVVFILVTIGMACNVKLSELSWVNDREYPGGPLAFEQGTDARVNFIGFVAYIIAWTMQDGFMLYRFMAVFNWTWYLVIIPMLVYLLSIVSSIIIAIQLNGGAWLFSSSTFDFAIAYWTSSIATTLLLTLLVVGKLLYMRYQLMKAFGGDPGSRTPYLSISAMLIESALLYSVFALPFLILYIRNDIAQNLFLIPQPHVQTIASELIILRVAQGKSFTSSIASTTTGAEDHVSSGPMRFNVDVELPKFPLNTTTTSPSQLYTLDSGRVGGSREQGVDRTKSDVSVTGVEKIV